ncbi:MAG: EFR1 family ferrodoxin [Treponemataceae bacterium]|nr:EFR1 family ferrodoxin [Treponemataceae bacterium]
MVFYFTGTGNSLFVAKNLDDNYFSIPQEMKKKGKLSYSDTTIGIVCPNHGHEIPPMVKEFIKRAEFNTEYLYMVITYGNNHGGAALIAAKYCYSVGKLFNYVVSMQMTDSFIPIFSLESQLKLDKHEDESVGYIKGAIDRRINFYQRTKFGDSLIHLIYVMSVHRKPATFWAKFKLTDNCTGCGICTKVCPGACIKLVDGKPVREMTNCQACYACLHNCPRKAIQINLPLPDKNPDMRYRNKHVSLEDIIKANCQFDEY